MYEDCHSLSLVPVDTDTYMHLTRICVVLTKFAIDLMILQFLFCCFIFPV